MVVTNGVWNFAVLSPRCQQTWALHRYSTIGQAIAVRDSALRSKKELQNTSPPPGQEQFHASRNMKHIYAPDRSVVRTVRLRTGSCHMFAEQYNSRCPLMAAAIMRARSAYLPTHLQCVSPTCVAAKLSPELYYFGLYSGGFGILSRRNRSLQA